MRELVQWVAMVWFGVAAVQVHAGVFFNGAWAQSGTYEDGRFITGPFVEDNTDAPHIQNASVIDYSWAENHATTEYVFDNGIGVASFNFNYLFSINGEIHTEGYGFTYGEFTVTTDTAYEVTHSMAITGGADRFLGIEFYEVDAFGGFSGVMVYSYVDGRDPYFGSTYGDPVNYLEGSRVGVLQAGKRYGIYALYDLHAFGDVGPSQATGHLGLVLRDTTVAAVPEPGAIVIWGAAAVCALGWRSRRRNAH